jgi:hypothetical protein
MNMTNEIQTDEEKKCIDKVAPALASRLATLREMVKAYEDPDNDDDTTEDGECLNEYGLCFDYVEPNTFDEQPDGFWRYQLSYGGPSEEFRFHDHGEIEFRYHDWYDGAGIVLMNEDRNFMRDLAENFFGIVFQPGWVKAEGW